MIKEKYVFEKNTGKVCNKRIAYAFKKSPLYWLRLLI